MAEKKRICVVGLGYIGLPTSALLANRGYQVYGVDVVPSVVETINKGEIHIFEPDLDIYVKAAVNSGKLVADTKPTYADVFIISVPTPFKEGYVPDLNYVVDATNSIIPYIRKGNIVILESTSPVGTTQKLYDIMKEQGVDVENIYLAYCPERVLPGYIMKELIENDRIVGGIDEKSTKVVAEFYREFAQGEVLETNAPTAEMAKLTENSYRDVNIAFANELSILCDKFGIDVWELIKLANRHPRVNILQPGAGVGGHCIAVDPWFIVYAGGDAAKLIKTARMVNNYKSAWVIEKIKNTALNFELEHHRKPIIACMGLAFKPNIDDLRESPALYITKYLLSEKLNVLAVEPNIKSHKEIQLTDYQTAVSQADIIVFLVAHKEFKNIQLENKTVLDFCGVTAQKRQ
jgi:UDP-N-acetyl-D-mannosaminuronic acid dehydrogenase